MRGVIFEGLLTQGSVLKSLALHLTLANHHHICLTLFLGLNISVYPFPFFQNHWRRLKSLAKYHWRASIYAKKYCKKLQLQSAPPARASEDLFLLGARKPSGAAGSTTWRPYRTPFDARIPYPCPMEARACVRCAIHGPWAPWGARSTRPRRGAKPLFSATPS